MSESAPKSYSSDPVLYLYTSLTSGSSHIVSATSRLETILKANRIPFKAIDIATDEKARMLWGRRSGKDETGRVRKIPGMVQMGLVIGDLVEIEEWNEYGELKEHVTIYHEGGVPATTVPSLLKKPSTAPALQENKKPEATAGSKAVEPSNEPPAGAQPTAFTIAMRQAGQEAAQKAKDAKKIITETFVGVGQAVSEKKESEENKAATKPPPISTDETLFDQANITAPTVLQSPTSTTWRVVTESTPTRTPSKDENEKSHMGSFQSPTSTSWKPSVSDAPVIATKGSSTSEASTETD